MTQTVHAQEAVNLYRSNPLNTLAAIGPAYAFSVLRIYANLGERVPPAYRPMLKIGVAQTTHLLFSQFINFSRIKEISA